MTAALAPAPASRLWTDAPGFMPLVVIMVLAALPLLTAMTFDPRTIGGESIWLKPLKFHLALAVYLGTLALYARWLPEGLTATTGWRIYTAVVIACIVYELLWIGGAATLGTTSHFNTSAVWGMLYGLAGIAAVTLTSPALVMGVAIARNRATGLPPALHLSVWLGLVMTFVLTVWVAGQMAGTPGHHVGTPVTGARVPAMGWSREVGDLRVAHFFATHALHALPLGGLAALALPGSIGRWLVLAAAAAFAALVVLSFRQALAGRPFL